MLASGTSSVVRLIRILRRLARQQKSADRNREAPSSRSAGNDVIRSQTTKSAGPKAGAVVSLGEDYVRPRATGRGRAGGGAGGGVARSRFTATLCGVTRRYVAEPNLSRVDKALLPADEYLWFTRGWLDHRSPL